MIDSQEETLTRILGAVAQDPAPPCAVDIAAVVNDGHRDRRRRRALTAGAMALLLAAGTAALTLPLRRVQQPDTRVHHAMVDPRDPLFVDAQFGWLPASMTDTTANSDRSPHVAMLWAKPPNAPSAGGGPSLTVNVYPKGQSPLVQRPDELDGLDGKGSPAPDVNGRPAYWKVGSLKAAPQLTLYWQSTDGQWVELSDALDPMISKADLLRVAADLTVATMSAPMPFYIAHSAGISVVSAEEETRGGGHRTASKAIFSITTTFGPGSSYTFDISAHTGAPPIFPSLPPQAEPNAGATHLCATERGLDICVTTFGPTPTAALRTALDHIVPLGTDLSRWTTDVLR